MTLQKGNPDLGLLSTSIYRRYASYRYRKALEMKHNTLLGKSNLNVPRMGLGAMIWGQPRGLARWTPAQLAYGPSHGSGEEERALEISLEAGVNLVDTAAMYSN